MCSRQRKLPIPPPFISYYFASTILSLGFLFIFHKMAAKTLSKTKQQKQQQRPKAQPSLAQQFNNFTDTTAGLEKTLRLIQALAQIIVEVSSHDVVTAARWSTAKSQLALSELRPGRVFDIAAR